MNNTKERAQMKMVLTKDKKVLILKPSLMC